MLEHFIQITSGSGPDGAPALYGLTSRGNIYVGTPVYPQCVDSARFDMLWTKLYLPALPGKTRAAPTSAPRQPPTNPVNPVNPATPPMPSLTSREVDDGK